MRESVIIVGSGMMGSGIAAIAAAHGRPVILLDQSLEQAERGVAAAKGHIGQLCSHGLVSMEAAERTESLLSASANMPSALEKARIVIEAIPENLSLKQEMFQKLDALLPVNVPIFSNTSGLQITDIAKHTQHPERALTAHFWFPAHLVPLVELVVGERSSLHFAEAMKEELLQWGKAPVIVKRDLPGQLANRVLQAVIREAVNIVEIGLASPEDVDTAIKMGMGIRLPVWGPLEHMDAVGLDLCLRVQDTVLPEISGAKEGSPYLRGLVAQDHLGKKTDSGVYDWSRKDMGALEQLRDEFIISSLQFLKEKNSQ